ncbi:hypothetical protein LVB77_08220 [Lysobacter sp. 5GHs7-4]|uniref:hypothetical protein n=1 Tax=Lysobacter sp. 5GHs7-4 TaxID=2904253 RepID=UPI001E329FDC|nr:hypothetical protein [Lysobacter sp. 5GHs7-4]UHQ24660.1 hypothetical protein LVB77_08220 [Lysobacter sp. 5GHs7-4]
MTPPPFTLCTALAIAVDLLGPLSTAAIGAALVILGALGGAADLPAYLPACLACQP